ncbi:UNVERIFIED_CONTAM: hypothetical protein PYX00_001876 [Menopon gallinae]|uniref:LIM zinc-binding domain-containing protein n=1 Tax=Menopon gallinae TaxID=328185 RepID=A0AAW2IFR8_9NEOP
MGFWIILEAFFRFLSFLSKFPKLLCRRMNQNMTYAPQLNDPRSKMDLECRSSEKRRSINLDSHFLAVEKVRKSCGRPMREGEVRSDNDLPKEPPVEKEGMQHPVLKVIELFDKPNEIETSLPRYQNKVACVDKGKSPPANRRKPMPLKMEKLKEQLQQQLAARLEKEDKRLRLEYFQPVVQTVSKDVSIMRGRYKSDLQMALAGDEEEVIRNQPHVWTEQVLSGKSEKEIQNSLLKVNLSHLKSEPAMRSDPALLKGCGGKYAPKETDLLHSKRRFASLAEVNYLRKSKERKANAEYGGGWDCHRCGERVYHAERMLACGNAYHRSCFSCVNCKKLLGPRTYLETEMEIYCSQCHAKKCGLTGYGYGLGPGVLQTSP